MPVPELRLTHIPSVKTGMLIRRPSEEVFQAFVDPAITTRFWFTKSSGKMVPGAVIKWDWEMYGVSAEVSVIEVENNIRILMKWDSQEEPTTVDFRFISWRDNTTYVQVTETGFRGTGDEVVDRAIDSAEGFTMMLCALKAFLEHGVVLTVVGDKAPAGLEA
jgi:uncharacterized protein YndB with AHSA1/START domain